jgi:hypothetical protein
MADNNAAFEIEIEQIPASLPDALTPARVRASFSETVPVRSMPATLATSADTPVQELHLRMVQTGKELGCGHQHIVTIHENDTVQEIVHKIEAAKNIATSEIVYHMLIGKREAFFAGRVTLVSAMPSIRGLVFLCKSC